MPGEIATMPAIFETLHGVSVADPYRWLEDRSSRETARWLAKQSAGFENYVRKLGSLETLRERVRNYVDVESVDQIGMVHDRFFYRKRGIADQQPSIYVMELSDRSERVLVDPSRQGPYTAVGIHRISVDASLLAFEVKQGGEHCKAIHVVDVVTGIVFPDHLDRGLARGFAFRAANDGFYYCHESIEDPITSDKDHTVLFHRMGTSMASDHVLLKLPRSRSSKLVLLADGDMLGAVYYHELAQDPVVDFYAAMQSEGDAWKCVCRNQPASFSPFFAGGRVFAHVFHNTPNGEIVELDATSGRPTRVIVPEWNVRSRQCVIAMSRLFVSYLVGTDTVVRVWSLDGDYLGELQLERGCTWDLVLAYSNEARELFLCRESFTSPPTLFRYQPKTGERTVWAKRQAPASAGLFVVRTLTYLSKDGAEVTLSLMGLADPLIPQNRPMIMTAYGGFGITMTPRFSAFVSVLLELGFLFALPQIRGGGERGNSWYEAARGRRRQTAFDDVIAAAEWLCKEGFTSAQRLAIFGGSNSGLLVGAAITQRPDLFRAALCMAPLLDMVRYHLFDLALNWAAEYGTADDSEDFRALLAYSPYHQVREGIDYPAVLFVSGDKDTRCNPAHARKMTARLQDRAAQERTILLDHSAERGHAPTMPLGERVNGITHRVAFLCHELGVPIPRETDHDLACR
jgi:prolyl oligopeptidase